MFPSHLLLEPALLLNARLSSHTRGGIEGGPGGDSGALRRSSLTLACLRIEV